MSTVINFDDQKQQDPRLVSSLELHPSTVFRKSFSERNVSHSSDAQSNRANVLANNSGDNMKTRARSVFVSSAANATSPQYGLPKGTNAATLRRPGGSTIFFKAEGLLDETVRQGQGWLEVENVVSAPATDGLRQRFSVHNLILEDTTEAASDHIPELESELLSSKTSQNKHVKYYYGLPQFSMLSLTLIISIYINMYYEKMGAKLYYLGFYTAVARSFDSMTDPLMGWLSDNARFKMGRRRPFMMVGMLGFATMFVLLMSPPIDREGDSTSMWFGVFYMLFYLFDTITNVPYYALGPELSDSTEERTKIFYWAKLYSGIGTLLGAASPAIMQGLIGVTSTVDESTGQGNPSGKGDGLNVVTDLEKLRLSFIVVGLIFTGLFVVNMSLVIFKIKERPGSRDNPRMPLVPSVLRTVKNLAFRPLLTGWTFDAIGLASIATSFPFFIQYVVSPPNPDAVLAYCFVALFVASLVGMPVWSYLARNFGKYRAWCWFNLLMAVTNVFFVFVKEGEALPVIIMAFCNGLPLGGQFLTDSILADTIEYDEFLNGTRNEGGFTVFSSFIPKFVAIPAGAIPLALLSAIGFRSSVNGSAQVQSDSVKTFIRILFVFVPTACAMLSYFIKGKYPIKNDYMIAQIAEGIALHRKGLAARDPVTGRIITLLQLSPAETQRAWIFDNFTKGQLSILISVGATPVVRTMWWILGVAVMTTISMITILGISFPRINDPVMSIVPVIAVILCGMSLLFVAVCVLRLKAALELQNGAVDVELCNKIIAFKDKGQRGGRAAEAAMLLGDYATAVLELKQYIVELEKAFECSEKRVAELEGENKALIEQAVKIAEQQGEKQEKEELKKQRKLEKLREEEKRKEEKQKDKKTRSLKKAAKAAEAGREKAQRVADKTDTDAEPSMLGLSRIKQSIINRIRSKSSIGNSDELSGAGSSPSAGGGGGGGGATTGNVPFSLRLASANEELEEKGGKKEGGSAGGSGAYSPTKSHRPTSSQASSTGGSTRGKDKKKDCVPGGGLVESGEKNEVVKQEGTAEPTFSITTTPPAGKPLSSNINSSDVKGKEKASSSAQAKTSPPVVVIEPPAEKGEDADSSNNSSSSDSDD